MPAGVSLSMVAAVLLPICVVTLLLRELPFSFIKALKGSQFIGLLGMTMPVGVMTVLVVYTVYGQKEAPGGILAALIGVAITAGRFFLSVDGINHQHGHNAHRHGHTE